MVILMFDTKACLKMHSCKSARPTLRYILPKFGCRSPRLLFTPLTEISFAMHKKSCIRTYYLHILFWLNNCKIHAKWERLCYNTENLFCKKRTATGK